MDVAAIYHQLVDTYVSSDSEADVETVQPGPSSSQATRVLPNRHLRTANDWKHEARSLLELLWHCEDSAPFRAPVDHIKHPGIVNVFLYNIHKVKEVSATVDKNKNA